MGKKYNRTKDTSMAVPENPKGTFEGEEYIPTVDEILHVFPEAKGNLEDVNRRKLIWAKPHTRHLVPFSKGNPPTQETLDKSHNTRRANELRRKEMKEQAEVLMDVIHERLTAYGKYKLDPEDVLQYQLQMAMVDGRAEDVIDIANKLMAYTKAKPATIQKNIDVVADPMERASPEDLEKFLAGDMTYEELVQRTKG